MDYTKLQSRISTSSSSFSSFPSTPSSPSSSSYIPLHKTQLHPRMHSFSLTPLNPKSLLSSNKSHHKYLFLFISISVLPFLFYLFALYRSIHLSSKFAPSSSIVFGAVIDIDDFRSQVRVFKYLNRDSGLQFIGKGTDSMSVDQSLHGILYDPDEAQRVVMELVRFAKSKVPKSERTNSKIQLFLSGDLEKDGVDVEEKLLDVCRRVLKSSGFLFNDEWASVLKGQDEGMYSWVAVNHALGKLGSEPQDTAGAIDLGGASLQISYAAREPPPSEVLRILRFGGVTYNLYAQSFTQFGQDVTWKSLHELKNYLDQSYFDSGRTINTPCLRGGYDQTSDVNEVKLLKSRAAGNFSACRSEVSALLKGKQGKCSSPPCNFISSLPIELKGIDLGERFVFTSKFLGVVPEASLPELEEAGRHFCEDEWNELKHKHRYLSRADMLRSCFSHSFVAALLRENAGVSSNMNRAGVLGDAGSNRVDWILGAFLYQMIGQPPEYEADTQDHIVGNESITYLLLFAVLLFFVLGAAFFVMKLRKPQLKTIYDLEKGRYIVTRVPR